MLSSSRISYVLIAVPSRLLTACTQIGFHAKAARSTDFGTLRPILWRYIPEVKLPGNRVLQALTCEQYQLAGGANLGFKSACTARLLVPIDLRTEFDESDDLEEYVELLDTLQVLTLFLQVLLQPRGRDA